MAGPLNKLKLPPGLGIPAGLAHKLKQANMAGHVYQATPANQYGPSVKTVAKGSLVYFNYLFWIHDPYPLVIISDIYPQYIRGLNLHYLTFPYIKHVLQPGCDNRNFSYSNIRGGNVPYETTHVPKAFRTYKRSGIRALKALDCSFILNVLASTRAIDPMEVDRIRQVVREQIQQQMRGRQPNAAQMSQKYMGMAEGQPQQGFANPLPFPVNPPPE